MSGKFSYSTAPEPHRERTRAILKAHPEVRQYMGKNPYTFGLIVAVVVCQISLAIWIRDQAWWLNLLLAYLVGAIATHALAIMIHECAHNLVFHKRAANYVAGILANLPMVIPSSVSFKRYHLKHHAFQGIYELDADVASLWEARLIGHSPFGKALWLTFFPCFYILRTMRLPEIKLLDGWTVLNILAVGSADVVIGVLYGPWALVYLAGSLFFSMGLHPLGGRWIQEHYVVHPPQETYSYYGPLNLVSLNVGYHNEHHDFPSVPWNRLPNIRHIASAWYDPLVAHTSLTRLVWHFILDPGMSLYARVVRQDRGDVSLTEELQPEREFSRNLPG